MSDDDREIRMEGEDAEYTNYDASAFLSLSHAAGDTQASGDSRKDCDYCLNNKFPSFFFHNAAPLPNPPPNGRELLCRGLGS